MQKRHLLYLFGVFFCSGCSHWQQPLHEKPSAESLSGRWCTKSVDATLQEARELTLNADGTLTTTHLAADMLFEKATLEFVPSLDLRRGRWEFAQLGDDWTILLHFKDLDNYKEAIARLWITSNGTDLQLMRWVGDPDSNDTIKFHICP